MAKSSRRRIEPAAAGDTHKVAAVTGLGSGSDLDAEQVALVADKAIFTQLTYASGTPMTNLGAGKYVSDWVACKDCCLLRIKAEYRAATGTRKFVVLLQDYTGTPVVWASGTLEPENIGLDDGTTLGAGVGWHAGGFDLFDVRGIAAYAVIVEAGATAVDVWGAAS